MDKPLIKCFLRHGTFQKVDKSYRTLPKNVDNKIFHIIPEEFIET